MAPSPRDWSIRIAPAIVVATLGALAPSGPTAQESGKADAARLRAMRAIAEEVKAETGPGKSRYAAERIKDPIYRFDDPTRSTGDGTVWAWEDAEIGRPVALLTIASEKSPTEGERWLCEWAALGEPRLTVVGPGPQTWGPMNDVFKPRLFSKAPVPAETRAERTRQMGELARRFRAFEFYKPPNGTQTNRYELRLLPKPIHRYARPLANDELIDGALFCFVSGTNPEIALWIEARHERPLPPGWTYGLARIAGAELHAELDGKDVWTQPVQFSPTPRDPYFVIVRPMNAAE